MVQEALNHLKSQYNTEKTSLGWNKTKFYANLTWCEKSLIQDFLAESSNVVKQQVRCMKKDKDNSVTQFINLYSHSGFKDEIFMSFPS